MIKSRAAIAFAPGSPLTIAEVDVAPPKAGEVLVKLLPAASATRMPLPSQAATRREFSRRFWATKAAA